MFNTVEIQLVGFRYSESTKNRPAKEFLERISGPQIAFKRFENENYWMINMEDLLAVDTSHIEQI